MKAPKRFIRLIEKEINIEEIVDWIYENSGGDGLEIETIRIAKEPTGDHQGDYEYCDQVELACENGVYACSGTYYHEFEDSDKWLAFEYFMSV